jgi:putative ABC transport system permease protein
MGCLLANGFAALTLNRLLEADYRFDLLPNAIAIAATPLVANAAGWLASWRILNQKPLEVLRHE